ncbi:protein LYK5 [Arachis duranensis]|uniref:Protein LYK5 n=1 Tax=Arachis duranensis TaxID=130453 RepID=A0A6P4DX45_ARADU|nr:protein LYK5 [Arachis duranensis]
MATTSILFSFLFLFLISSTLTEGQQIYLNNDQLDCDTITNSTLGNTCNSIATCQSYLTFKSATKHNTAATISTLLNSTPTNITTSNNLSTVSEVIPTDTLITIPVTCSCFNNTYYQHNTTYTISADDTYFSLANNTFEALTTCQALIAQNPSFPERNLQAGERVHVPLRCACPTKKQRDAGFKYLLTYLVSIGESISSIAEIFGVDVQSVLDANELSESSVIYYFTPISVPLKTEPPKKLQRVAQPPESPPPPVETTPPSGGSGNSKKWVVVGVVIGVVVLLLVLGFVLFFICFRRRTRQPETAEEAAKAKPFYDSTSTEEVKKGSLDVVTTTTSTSTTQSWSVSSEGVRYAIESLTVYRFEELQKATGFFGEDNRIKGSSVYRASFKGDDAAVKVLKGDVSAEINILKMINHTNVTRLSGFCVHKGNTYLVYEFAENGDLDDWLHNHGNKNKDLGLSWKQRVQVAHDVADALNYLHNYTNPSHVHKDLKSGNILLDGNFRAKVSNFGLARAVEDQGDDGNGGFQLTRHVVGTQGYMPAEYIENGVITPKMDVFAFGVVILELLSGREAVGFGEDRQVVLSSTIGQVLEGDNVRENLREFMDPSLEGVYPLDLAYSMAELAKKCVARDINSRPNISEVFMTLSKIQSSTLNWDPSDELERFKSVSQMSDTDS